MSYQETMNVLLERAARSPKPNFTQYQLAISELSCRKRRRIVDLHVGDGALEALHEFQTAEGFRILCNLMERQFDLPTLDDLIPRD